MFKSNSEKIVHIITGLNLGGAEMMLYKLIKASPAPEKHIVVSLLGRGFFADKIEKIGCTVIPLNLKKKPIQTIIKLPQIVKEYKPIAIQCWMFHANVIGCIIGVFAGIKNICFGIHHTISSHDKFMLILLNKISALLSKRFCKAVICCGNNPLVASKKSGYKKDILKCIYNGFDIQEFRFSQSGRNKIRKEFNFSDSDFVIVHMARFHYLKNHVGLLRIFAEVLKKNPNAKLLLVGDGLIGNETIENQLNELNIKSTVKFAGLRTDVIDIYSASDVSVLPSLSEGFPNVLGEAMLCECPCVATDVGDASFIIGNKDFTFEVSDETGFADKLVEISNLPSDKKNELRNFSRNRIVENFDIKKIYKQYLDLWSN